MSVVSELLWNSIYCLTYLIYRCTLATVHVVRRLVSSSTARNHCQVFRIIWRRKLFKIDVASSSDFLGIHETMTFPKYVLHPNVSLYCVTIDQAIFVETPKDIDVYSSKTNPFQYIAQFEHATKFITMPINYFNALADEIGKPKLPVGYLANTGRCGSTILAQVLENIPGTLVHAEPDALTNISQMRSDKSVSTTDREKLLVSTIKILCKPTNGIRRICIKTRSCTLLHIENISKHFPEVKIMFGYRNSKSTVSSFLGLMISETVQSLSLYAIDSDRFSDVCPFFRRQLHFYFVSGIEREPPLVSKDQMNSVELFSYAWACSMSIVLNFKKNGGCILPISYEELLNDTRAICTRVFEALHINLRHIETALTAFKNDSQTGSPLSQDNINNPVRRRITESNRMRADKVLQQFGMPGLGVEVRI